MGDRWIWSAYDALRFRVYTLGMKKSDMFNKADAMVCYLEMGPRDRYFTTVMRKMRQNGDRLQGDCSFLPEVFSTPYRRRRLASEFCAGSMFTWYKFVYVVKKIEEMSEEDKLSVLLDILRHAYSPRMSVYTDAFLCRFRAIFYNVHLCDYSNERRFRFRKEVVVPKVYIGEEFISSEFNH